MNLAWKGSEQLVCNFFLKSAYDKTEETEQENYTTWLKLTQDQVTKWICFLSQALSLQQDTLNSKSTKDERYLNCSHII